MGVFDGLGAGATRYLGSAAVAVALAPVVPDIFVDLWGGEGGAPPWLLRAVAILLVIAACFTVYGVQRSSTRRRARRAGGVLAGIGRRDVLVVPVSYRSGYTRRGHRTAPNSVIEWLVDTSRPTLVVLVPSPESADRVVDLRVELLADGVADVRVVELPDVGDPGATVPDAERLLVPLLLDDGRTGAQCYVDTTGGTVPMSLAMLRVGAAVGAECTYVVSEFKDDKPVPGSQRGVAFLPPDLFAPTP